ncbi:MAG: winged helix-turn-helix domain-containing protein [Cyanobacteriota bacterium]|nr:winged helix-turn-helix domain-containing protein [Cyanobacteriota bacterium]
MGGPTVLLLGAEAEALASRLEASGYQPLLAAGAAPPALPDVVVLAAAAVGRIPALRAAHGGTPILLDLIDDSLEARSHCLTSGADDFWLSSLGPSDLLLRLRLHLGLRQQRRPETVLKVADLVITPSRRQVRRGSRSVALTAREYQLLLFLVERAGQVLSRDTILARVWSDQQEAASNVIEVYVRYLRQKLEAGGERRLIHTVRGQGYSLASKPPLQA